MNLRTKCHTASSTEYQLASSQNNAATRQYVVLQGLLPATAAVLAVSSHLVLTHCVIDTSCSVITFITNFVKTGRVIEMLQHDTVLLHALSRMCVNGNQRTVAAVTKEVECRSKNSEWACRVTTEKPKNMMDRARVRSRASICEIYGGQHCTGTSFSPNTRSFPVSIIPPMLLAHSLICHRRCIISAVDNVVK